MSYTDVEWTSLDTVTEAKLDTMQGNLDYLREHADYQLLGSGAGWHRGESWVIGGHTPGTAMVRLVLPELGLTTGSVTLQTSPSPTSASVTHQAIPGTTPHGRLTLGSVWVEWRPDGSSSWARIFKLATSTFFLQPEIAYASIWAYLEAWARTDIEGNVNVNQITVRISGLQIVGART